MEIRRATMEDLDMIATLEQLCFPAAEAASRKSFEDRLREFGDYFWLLYEDDTLVALVNGMVTDLPLLEDRMFEDATMHDENGLWQMIFGVETHPDYRNRGYASMLLSRVISDVKTQGRKGIVLTCKEALIPFYAKLGFENEGVSSSEHGGAVWYDMRLMF